MTDNPADGVVLSREKLLYLQGETEIALNPRDPRHREPKFPPGARVLGIGAGGGYPGQADGLESFISIDPDPEALAYRLMNNPEDKSVIGVGEDLSRFADNQFDFVYARGCLMYTHIPTVMRQVARVLEPGGTFWITYHDWHHELAHLGGSVRRGVWKDVIYRSYIMGNGLLYHLTGSLLRFPFNRARMESYQTRSALARELIRSGFENVTFPPPDFPGQIPLLVTATRRRS